MRVFKGYVRGSMLVGNEIHYTKKNRFVFRLISEVNPSLSCGERNV